MYVIYNIYIDVGPIYIGNFLFCTHVREFSFVEATREIFNHYSLKYSFAPFSLCLLVLPVLSIYLCIYLSAYVFMFDHIPHVSYDLFLFFIFVSCTRKISV